MTNSTPINYVRADIGTFAEHGHSTPEPSAELKAENRIALIGDWAKYCDEWDVGDVRPGGPDAPIEYVIFYAGPYTGQIMPTQDDGDPLPAGQAPTQNYWDRRNELMRDEAESQAEAVATAEAEAAATVDAAATAAAATADAPATPEELTPAAYLRRLVDAGMAEPAARTTVSAVMVVNMNRQVVAAAQDARERGNETSAALLLIAYSAVDSLPKALRDADGDVEAADAAFAASRQRLNSSGQMFDMMRGGREPVFANVEAMIDEAREVLTVEL